MEFNNEIPRSELFSGHFSLVHYFDFFENDQNRQIMKTFYGVIFFPFHFYTIQHFSMTFYILNIYNGTIQFRRSMLNMSKSELIAFRIGNGK